MFDDNNIRDVIGLIAVMDCYYHPKNPLLNFCNNPSCALPLCPKCISIHLSQSSSFHEVVSLNDAVASTSEQLDTVCEGLAHELRLLVPTLLVSDRTSTPRPFWESMEVCCRGTVRKQ
jgi:hypothetical protein